MKVTAIIVAAGSGSRMGAAKNKIFLPLSGKCVLSHTLDVFAACRAVDKIIVVTRAEDMAEAARLTGGCEKPVKLVCGGAARQASVKNGLAEAEGADFVIIHDGARALVTGEIIEATLRDAQKYGAAAAGVPCKDTLKSADSDGFITGTLDREATFLIQTPQIFRFGDILHAHSLAEAEGYSATDDCMLYEKYIGRVKITRGSYDNLKLTTPEDMIIAEEIIKRREKQ